MGNAIFAAIADASIRGLPLQRHILRAMQHDLIEWNHDGKLTRARATGELFGAEADPFVIGYARFVPEDGSPEVWEYPTKVLADGGHFVNTPRNLPSLLEFMLEDADLDPDTKAELLAALDQDATPTGDTADAAS